MYFEMRMEFWSLTTLTKTIPSQATITWLNWCVCPRKSRKNTQNKDEKKYSFTKTMHRTRGQWKQQQKCMNYLHYHSNPYQKVVVPSVILWTFQPICFKIIQILCSSELKVTPSIFEITKPTLQVPTDFYGVSVGAWMGFGGKSVCLNVIDVS